MCCATGVTIVENCWHAAEILNERKELMAGEKMTRIILVRHGQTEWNVQFKYQGHSEVDLTPTGVRQAERVAARLANEPICAVYSSDLGRALKTAEHIASSHHLSVTPVKGLREYHFGEWEGLTFQQISERWPEISVDFFKNPDSVRVPGGETFGEVKARAEASVRKLVDLHPDQTVALVSHGGTIRTILCAALGLHLNRVWALRQDNTAVNIIEYYQETAIVALVNDIHHLSGE
jgi:alpha-ribazole phosphatase